MAYRTKTGPLDAGSKLEGHLATVQALIVQAMGGKSQPADFLYGAEPEHSEEGIDMKQVIAAFQSIGEL
ncbi:hypothetical protein [Salinisphaera sp.]|uniref:hypothetical protein n=1 Tax=Salinisphaera sp. TaxID=1914330 RepID=UPI000C3B53B6|nr:hypothetical protein [Salinisphaera sp.]MAS10299.1 hypothetical protein [Salinisphaera sp.]|tara:strand:+ start:1192 stop:1398 length:207 start_codon:yes stop_codon:yes gene_type:complete